MKKSAKTKIPEEVKVMADKIITDFNSKVYKKNSGVEYYAIYKGAFLYLNRKEGRVDGPIARLTYTGEFDQWDFAIFKWSTEKYDPTEFFFSGSNYIDGTVEGALKAGNEAYPASMGLSLDTAMGLFLKHIYSKKNLKNE